MRLRGTNPLFLLIGFRPGTRGSLAFLHGCPFMVCWLQCKKRGCKRVHLVYVLVSCLAILWALVASVAIGVSDWRTQHFAAGWLAGLAGCGVAWCIVQSFIPAALLPLGIGAGVIAGVNALYRPIMGGGDLLLLCVAGFFILLKAVALFLIVCGGLGALIHVGLSCYGSRRAPFSAAILIAMWSCFLLQMVG